MIWTAEPSMNEFGLTTEATISGVAAIQCAANRIGGGEQQSTTTNLIFLPNINGLVELVRFMPCLNNVRARPRHLAPVASKFTNMLTSR